MRLSLLAAAYHKLGRSTESDKALAQLIEHSSNGGACQVAEVYAFRGETDKAFTWLERAREQRDNGLWGVKGDFMLDKIRGDPRYTALLRKLHIVS